MFESGVALDERVRDLVELRVRRREQGRLVRGEEHRAREGDDHPARLLLHRSDLLEVGHRLRRLLLGGLAGELLGGELILGFLQVLLCARELLLRIAKLLAREVLRVYLRPLFVLLRDLGPG